MMRTLYSMLLMSLFLSTISVAQTEDQEELIPFSRVEVKKAEVTVGTPAIVTIKLFVPTYFKGQAEFPIYDSINVIVKELVQDPPEKARNIEGRDWTVISKVYWMLPMEAGDYSFPAESASGTYPDPVNSRRIDTTFDLNGFSFSATLPAGAEELDPLIVANGLTLKQTWDGIDDPVEESGAITRTVVAKIDRSSALFLPPLIEPVTSELVKVYPQNRVVKDLETYKGLGGSREESVSYVAKYGGELTFPAISVQWFNTKTKKIETATVEGLSVVIDAPEKPVEPLLSRKQIIVLAGLLLCLAFLIWAYRKWVSPVLSSAISALKHRWENSEPFASREVIAAIRSHDLNRVYCSYQFWSERQNVPGYQESRAFTAELLNISKHEFGNGDKGNWDTLEQDFKQLRRIAKSGHAGQNGSALPKLNPFDSR